MAVESMQANERLLNNIQQKTADVSEWTPPLHFKLSEVTDATIVNRMFDEGVINNVVDPIHAIADDLFEYENPSLKHSGEERKEFVEDIVGQGVGYGEWVYFPWSQSLVRYADRDTHRALRTARNRDLITQDEQAKLYDGTAAVFGLSVGGSAVRQMALAGVAGTLITADMDAISLSNTNRLEATQKDLGQKKIDVLAKHISQLDPFIKQVLLRDGVNEQNIEEVIEDYRPNLMVDAVDSLAIKALIRSRGAKYGVPVLMATDVGERSLLDIEMYGKEENVKPFGGRVSEEDYQKLLSHQASDADMQRLMFDIVDPSNASQRMFNSVMSVFEGKLPGLPQLGATATLGGIAVTRAAREIILGNEVRSGRSFVDMDHILARD